MVQPKKPRPHLSRDPEPAEAEADPDADADEEETVVTREETLTKKVEQEIKSRE